MNEIPMISKLSPKSFKNMGNMGVYAQIFSERPILETKKSLEKICVKADDFTGSNEDRGAFRPNIMDYTDRCPNKFIGRKGCVPDMIVFHNTGGRKISSAHHWFLNPKSQTSAHFLVGRDGEIRQYVSIADGAWCNGTSATPNAKHYYANAKSPVVKSRPKNANLYTVSVEFVGNSGETFTTRQKVAAVVLCDYIRNEIERIYGTRPPLNRLHIIPHCEVVPLTRPTCGKHLPIETVIRKLEVLEEARAPFCR